MNKVFAFLVICLCTTTISLSQISIINCYDGNRDDFLYSPNSFNYLSKIQSPLKVHDSLFLQVILTRSDNSVFSQNTDTLFGKAYLACINKHDVTLWMQPLDSFDLPTLVVGNEDSIFIASLNFNTNRKIVGQWWDISGHSISPLYILKDIDTLADTMYYYESGYLNSYRKGNNIFLRCTYLHFIIQNWYPYIYNYSELLKVTENQLVKESPYSAYDNAYFPNTTYNVDLSYGECKLINDDLNVNNTYNFIRAPQKNGIYSTYLWSIEDYDYLDTSTTLSWINLNTGQQIQETFKHTIANANDSILILVKEDSIRIANIGYPLDFYTNMRIPFDSILNIKILYSDLTTSLFLVNYIQDGIYFNKLMNNDNKYIELTPDQLNLLNYENYQYIKELNLLIYFTNSTDTNAQPIFKINAINSQTLVDTLIWITNNGNYYSGYSFFSSPYLYFNINTISDSCNGELSDVLFLRWKALDLNTGIKLLTSEDKFNISPNPASSSLTLNFKDVQDDGNLTVFDINGKIVLEKSIKSQQEIINTSDWVNGIYFMRYQTKDILQTEKVLIQH